MYATSSRSGRAGHVQIARERPPAFDARPNGPAADTTATDPDALEVAVAALVDRDLDECDEEQVRDLLGRAQRAVDRLLGFRSKAAGVLESRALRAAGPGRENQALRQVRDRTADELRLTPSDVKRAGETGRRLAEAPAAQAAMTSGQLPADHARVLADTLRHLSAADRDRAESELLEAARHQDAKRFGRTCRRLLAELDATAADRAQQQRHRRRHLRVTETPDGMLAMHGQGSGWDAEVVATALHAFTRTTANDGRTAEQRTWDGLVSVCQTALDAGRASTNRGVRPHVLVTMPHPDPAASSADASDGDDPATARDGGHIASNGSHPLFGDGPAGGIVEGAWTGPMPWTEVRRHLIDVGVSRLLVDAAGLPLEASEEVRTVPAGLWKALQVRDPECIAVGCTVPAAWRQVMHLADPYRTQGRLSLTNAALGCSRHHRSFDRHGWRITWVGRRPVLHHPERPPPEVGADPGQDPIGREGAGPPSDGAGPDVHAGQPPAGGADPP